MVVKRKSDYLAHHGIKGQSWGDQNGPPYPLDSQVSSAVKKKKSKSFIQKLKDKKKGKKLQAARKAKAEEKKEKEEIINSGDEKKIKKIQHKLTDEEYQRALNRIDLKRKLNSVNYDNINAKIKLIGNIATTVGNIGTAANNVLDAKNKLTGTKANELSSLKEKKDIAQAKSEITKEALNMLGYNTQIKAIKKNPDKYISYAWKNNNNNKNKNNNN